MQRVDLKSKPDMVRARIIDLANRLGPGARLPRVAQMCRDFDVALNTLNLALRDVEEAGLITRRRGAGIFVTKKTKEWTSKAPLALICRPSLFQGSGHSPFWDLLMEIIQVRAEKSGVPCDCYFSREKGAHPPLPAGVVKAIEEHHIGGVFGVGLPKAGSHWIMEQGVPVVNLFSPGNVTVLLNPAQTLRLGVQALREKGCRRIRIVFWMPTESAKTPEQAQAHYQEQRLFFEQALPELSELQQPELQQQELQQPELLPMDEAHYPWMNGAEGMRLSSTEQGFETARHIFQKPRDQWPDGIMINDDLMTHGFLMALRQMKLQAGRDIQIATHSNKGTPLLMGEDDLIRVEVDPEEVVAAMFERMENLLRQTPDAIQKKEEEQIIISAHLRPPLSTPSHQPTRQTLHQVSDLADILAPAI